MPFLEIARKLLVSGGTIHQRIEKLKESGVIIGSSINVNYKKLGLGVTVLLGIHLNTAKSINMVMDKLDQLSEVTEVYYTTGNYALIVKVLTKDIDHFHNFLVKKLQSIDEIRSTESFICLRETQNKESLLSEA